MTRDQLFKSVGAGQIGRAYVFYGPETLVRENAVGAVMKKLLPEGLETFNLTVLEGAVTAAQVVEAGETLPLMCSRRLVVLRECPFLTGRGKKRGDGEADEASGDGERLAKWLENLPDTCCLIAVSAEEPDKRKKCSQALKKTAEWVEFAPLSDADMLRWCAREVKAQGHDIAADAVQRLTFMAGRELHLVRGELGKLCAYVGERRTIMPEDVEAIVTPSTECTVFQMIDSLMRGQTARACALMKNMLLNGETPYAVVAMLTRQMRMLTHIRLLRADGVPLQEIERRFSWNSYALKIAAQQAARFSAESLEAGYRACVETDFGIKNGRMRPEAGLDALVFTLSRMTA